MSFINYNANACDNLSGNVIILRGCQTEAGCIDQNPNTITSPAAAQQRVSCVSKSGQMV